MIIALTTLLFMVPSLWLMRRAAPMLKDMDPLELQSVMGRIVLENKHSLNLVTFSFLGIWAYAITQAYFKARESSAIDSTTPKE